MKSKVIPFAPVRGMLVAICFFITSSLNAQTNVYTDVIASSPNHTYLSAALQQEGLDVVLQDPSASYTVFAPDNDAIQLLADNLGTDISGVLSNPDLSSILLYHVLGTEVVSSGLSNGDLMTPLNNTNTIKVTVSSMGSLYVNQAMVNGADLTTDNGTVHSISKVILPSETVIDVALDNGFISLASAVIKAELLPALTDPFGTFTVFAPTDDAFTNLAAALGTDINGLLALPNLADILTYHVIGSLVPSTEVTNGAIVNPLSSSNTLKLTATSGGDVFVNQASVTSVDISADNGIVHVLDAVVLPNETVIDVALDNGFNALASAVVASELMPLLTNPLATYTVFAPTDQAFQNLADLVGVPLSELFNPSVIPTSSLQAVLGHHVLGAIVPSGDVTNGAIIENIVGLNTLKMTVTGAGNVFVNQAEVTSVDIDSDNGIVHVINSVLLPDETVVDVAIDNGFSTLTTAVITAELLPALTDPYNIFTVFAPSNDAFDDLATALGTDINGILALPNLADILLYHVVSGEVLSTDLTNGSVTTLNGEDVVVDISNGVMINDAMVTLADVAADNGLVHVINSVLVPSTASLTDNILTDFEVYPNPASDIVTIDFEEASEYTMNILSLDGRIIDSVPLISKSNKIDIQKLNPGKYFIEIRSSNNSKLKALDVVR